MSLKNAPHFLLILLLLTACAVVKKNPAEQSFNTTDVARAEKLIGLEFSAAKRDSMLESLEYNLTCYKIIRELHLENAVPPALRFDPLPENFNPDYVLATAPPPLPRDVALPENPEDLAFYTVAELSELLRTRQVSSRQLMELYLDRLQRYGPELECVVTLTTELAREQADRADAEIAAGNYRGPLHGIPYGAKDLLAVAGYPTTWGAVPYQEQVIDETATVIKKLDEAGAVLVAKLTLGALAWGDVWFGGMTRNPWNLEQGSSGSSAGPGSATAAGLVAFAIGSETWGSIVSPANRCGVTGLRPTYDRVCRTGAMTLSWSMDKLGPMCRSVEDCALVLAGIYGPTETDKSAFDIPFAFNPEVDLKSLKIGYLKEAFEEDYPARENDRKVLEVLTSLGAELIPIGLPDLPVAELGFILSAEAAAAFDDLTLSGRDDLLVRQIKNAWPNEFRTSRFIPAVEYIQANRVRYQLVRQMQELFQRIDVYVAPSFGGDNLLLTNLTGHPCVVVPNGFDAEGSPTSISFIGRLFDENTTLALARQYQQATDWHRQYPPRYK
ncbi:MAG: amidase [Candidatus Neomarinimicrobiota bacterium]